MVPILDIIIPAYTFFSLPLIVTLSVFQAQATILAHCNYIHAFSGMTGSNKT